METKIVISVALVTLASLVLMIEGCGGPNCFNPQWKKDAGTGFYDENDTQELLEQQTEDVMEAKVQTVVKSLVDLLRSAEYTRDRRTAYKGRDHDERRRGFGSRIITLKKKSDN